ncbi:MULTISPECIES: hypothetical protein [Streptomyces]|uniref:SCO2584 family spore wall biosynthesis protein n=1 Tax=Streptomyces TaxID=1883 RepID=UPI001D14ACDC|nr:MULTISPECIES: hypothetical protein [Streptomyces]MCC3654146.1 hypothetical protein [Streptomyces sp. S07_1.15]WSQ71430.1 hypothetical protein OG463_08260 [Streptomyces xinghaiensis]
MPDDVGGRPFPDGDEPDSHHHGAADEEFATVVFDEDFIRSAPVHEPTAVERMLAAAQARAEAEAARRSRPGVPTTDEELYELYGVGRTERDAGDPWYEADGGEHDPHDPYGPYGGALRPYRGRIRWHRPVAWVLAVVMGVGMVALAFAAVYRGESGARQDPAPPPATTGVDGDRIGGLGGPPGGLPPVSADTPEPTAPAARR